ncbi:MAG TPA: hypothetical protein VGX25_27300 [Actinophytocola sp.]|uniref:hypothetical protein n=1 Tax=Actinophytocola sp. TaxID=1872138 RepID=UPI002DDD3760|nr:hypothetical protein [Actinophytocola sp.]HEV2783105.1 hypothetical protein [Actinophytocola sp.]
MRSVTRVLIVALLALLVGLPGAVVAASASAGPVAVIGLDQPTTQPVPPTTARPGPALTPGQESAKSRQKLVIGLFAAILLGIVVVGRRAHIKRLKKAGRAVSK